MSLPSYILKKIKGRRRKRCRKAKGLKEGREVKRHPWAKQDQQETRRRNWRMAFDVGHNCRMPSVSRSLSPTSNYQPLLPSSRLSALILIQHDL
jgi:hypothetical protein